MIHLALQRDAAPIDRIGRWIYAGADTSWLVRAEHGPLAGMRRVPTGELLEAASWRIRTEYIDWIGELSAVNAGREWWASELAAKNPFTLLYPRICAAVAARDALAADGSAALVVCSTPALLEAMARVCQDLGLAHTSSRSRSLPDTRAVARRVIDAGARLAPAPTRALGARLPLTARRAVQASPELRRRDVAGLPKPSAFSGPRTALLVTWVDERSLADGRYVDPHFGALPQLLAGAGWDVAYLPRVLPGADFGAVVRALAGTGERFYHPDAWIERSDWREARRTSERWSPRLRPAELGGVPVDGLAREQLDAFRWSHEQALAYEHLVRRLSLGGVAPARLILPFEGHSWEQALVDAARRHMPETVTVGFDNVNFSRLALSLYPARSEEGRRPLPDRIVTSGETFKQVLLQEGYAPERVRGGCALRHAYLADVKPGDRGTRRVLVAASIDAGQSFEIIDKAARAFADGRYEVVVKLHPAVDRDVLDPLLEGIGGLVYEKRPIGELLREVDAMLYGYSVVCYEALAAGVQPVFVRSETFLDLDQLEPFEELRCPARTPQEICAAVDAALARTPEEYSVWLAKATAAVQQALGPIGPGCVTPFID